MEFYFLPFNFLLFFSFLSLDRQLVDFTYPSFLLFKFLKSKEWMEQWKKFDIIKFLHRNRMFSKKGKSINNDHSRTFLSTRCLIPIFPLEIKGFTLLRRNFSPPFFFRTAGQDALSKLEQFFDARRVWRGGRIYIGGEPATIKFKIYDDTFAASKVALNFRYA